MDQEKGKFVKLTPENFEKIVFNFQSLKPILVVGDLGIDKYTYGEVKRISPEAPVPVLEVQKEWNKFLSSSQPIEEWISETELENLVTKKHFKTIEMKRIPITLMENIPQIEVYQLWLFQKVTTCKI
jgi:hypothetical protein